MTNLDLAISLRHGLFADRDSVSEAWEYAFQVLNSLPAKDRVAATTAMMVLINTISKEIIKNERGEAK